MKTREFLKGIEIITSNMPKEELDSYNLHCEHDQLWFGRAEWVTDKLDLDNLEKLGWFIDQDSWSCFS